MNKLTVADLWDLEEYAEQRADFRKKVIAHKKDRTVRLGPRVTLLFEDRMLVHYQLQETLRVESIVEPEAIQDELDAHNLLIPNGGNWKATCVVEFGDDDEVQLLADVGHRIWAQVGQLSKVRAVVDEDPDRASDDPAFTVHFLRFELPASTVAALRSGAALRLGVDHPDYGHATAVGAITRASLLNDLKK